MWQKELVIKYTTFVGIQNRFLFYFIYFFIYFRAEPTVYGGSQARDQIRATAASLGHSHNNMESKLCLGPTPQLMATPDTQPTKQGQGLNPYPHRYQSDSFPLSYNRNSFPISLDLNS